MSSSEEDKKDKIPKKGVVDEVSKEDREFIQLGPLQASTRAAVDVTHFDSIGFEEHLRRKSFEIMSIEPKAKNKKGETVMKVTGEYRTDRL